MGNYNPVVQLTAPDKLQLFLLKTLYKPTPKTTLNIETAFSSNDDNLFSTIDDENNKGLATKIGWEQLLLQNKWELKSNVKFDYLNEYFTSIERIQSIEFNRDWNIETIAGTQKLLNTSLQLSKQKNKVIYEFENLEFSDYFTGNKHQFYGNLFLNNLSIAFNNSILNSKSTIENGVFSRNFITAKYNLKKSWYGVLFNTENNKKL